MKPIANIKYINGECITTNFRSLTEATQYVKKHYYPDDKYLNSNTKRNIRGKISKKIKDSIKNKNDYHGQWIWLEEIGGDK